MARLVYYGSVCAGLPVLRRKRDVPAAEFRLPMGTLFAVLAVGVSLLLFPRLDRPGAIVLGVLAVCIIANTVWAARRDRTRDRTEAALLK